MPSHWIWDQSPPKDSLEVRGVEAFFVRTNPPPDLQAQNEKILKYSKWMEKKNIFQKDGKDENIPK